MSILTGLRRLTRSTWTPQEATKSGRQTREIMRQLVEKDTVQWMTKDEPPKVDQRVAGGSHLMPGLLVSWRLLRGERRQIRYPRRVCAFDAHGQGLEFSDGPPLDPLEADLGTHVNVVQRGRIPAFLHAERHCRRHHRA